MPLLWKKSRISKMVTDLRSPKRRGESMVVQTGFPTSLIDLFVKNRDRLRKQKKNTTNKNRTTSLKRSDVIDSVDQVSDKIVSCSEDGCDGLSVSVIPSSGEIEVDHAVSEDTDSCVSGGTDVGGSCEEVVEVEELGRGGCGGDVSLVYVALAKVFAVVALALCTTQFAVGITLAAFLLLFLEFIGKYFGCLKKPYLNVKSGLQYMAERIGYGILVLRSDVVVKEKSDGVVFELVEPGVESDFSVEEIKIVGVQSSGNEGVSGSNFVDEGSSPRGSVGVEGSVSPSGTVCIDESVSPKGLIEYLIMDAKISEKTEESDHTDHLSASVCEKSKSRKMGGKFIKKFVSQKLRIKSKKYQSGTDTTETKPRNKVCVSMVQEGSVKQECQIEGFSAEEESENSPLLSVNSVNKSEIQEADGIVTSWIVEKKGTESKDNFGYLMLFLIALVGLIGGRVLALLLIITWCFMLRVISSWRSRIRLHALLHEKAFSPNILIEI